MLIPTLKQLRNQRNISQIQERVYRKLKVYESEFNTCQLSARNSKDSYTCGDLILKRLNVEMPTFIKSVLDEY